jgi:hypothetical protein
LERKPGYGKHYLAWKFSVSRQEKYRIGGEIVIDVHDGHIINLNEIV